VRTLAVLFAVVAAFGVGVIAPTPAVPAPVCVDTTADMFNDCAELDTSRVEDIRDDVRECEEDMPCWDPTTMGNRKGTK
jgi:hypothetical protein